MLTGCQFPLRQKLTLGSSATLIIEPNPATDYIYISDLPQSGDVLIYNSMGMEVGKPHPNSPQGEGTFKIDVSALPSGLYFVRCAGALGKFVKE